MILVVIWKCYFEDGNAATAMEEAEKKDVKDAAAT